jgi:hypothetical protein
MSSDPAGGNPLDRLTLWVMKQSSRRNFLGIVGATGLAALGLIPGWNRLAWAKGAGLAAMAPAVPNSNPCEVDSDCGVPCTGICNCAYSDCITGGRACSCTCSDPCLCFPKQVKAHGSWQCVRGACFFSCTCPAC